MKIAIVLNTSWNIYNFRLGLIDSLLEAGHEVTAVAPYDSYTHLIINRGCRYEKVTMDSRGANPVKDFLLTFELFRIYKKIRPDVILHFTIKPNIYGTVAARLLNIPTINNVCGLGTVFLKGGILALIAKTMYKLAFRFPNKVFFQNQDDLNLFLENDLIGKEKTDILPGSGINLSRFHPESKPENKEFTFLLISRLIYDKGILEYIEAIRKLRKKGVRARYQLLGAMDTEHKRGIPAELIQSWIDTNQVEYLGHTHDVRPYISHADCIILPSYREGTPRSLLEAAAMARPVIATDVAGCNNVVIDGHNGYLCNLKDSSDLAEKMESMAGHAPDELQRMGHRGRQRVETLFDEKRVIDKYKEELSKL